MYCTSKVIYGAYSWSITNAGAAGVTATYATTVTAKGFLSSSYNIVTISLSTGLFQSIRSTFISGTTLTTGQYSVDSSAADFNVNGNYSYTSNGALLSTTLSIGLGLWSTAGTSFSVYDIATPITAI
jgi:hypothetical protein